MELISMTDFVLLQSESIKSDIIGYGEFIDKVVKYANFIKQQLALDMFVPCDESGNLLITYDPRYQQAKERVLFEFQDEYLSWDSTDMGNQTIEDLLTDDYTYIITQYALKQIGL